MAGCAGSIIRMLAIAVAECLRAAVIGSFFE
jgi:hypothetical protein